MMEEPQKITIPGSDTDFGGDAFDSTPIKHGRFGGFNEWVFSLMRPKKKVTASQRSTISKVPVKPIVKLEVDTVPDIACLPKYISNTDTPKGYETQNGLLLQKKTLAMRVRDQIRFPAIKSASAMIHGLALVVFAVGAYLLYSALPTRPDLIIGIILVSLAGNVIIAGR